MTRLQKVKKLLTLLVLVLALFLPSVSWAAGDIPESERSGEDMAKRVYEIADLLKKYHVDSGPDDDPIFAALANLFENYPELYDLFLAEMFAGYDQYTWYVRPGLYDIFYPQSTAYVGIGIVLSGIEGEENVVDRTLPGGPAEEGGILARDRITAVDGKPTAGLKVEEITSIVRGEEDTPVTLTIERGGETHTFTLTRRPIRIANVTLTDLGEGRALIRIERFGDLMTFIEFADIYSKLEGAGFTSVIFDLRGNLGGDIDLCANMLNYVVPEEGQHLFSLRYTGGQEQTYTSTRANWQPENMYVLTSSNTASSAEIFAGVLRDLCGAVLVGTTTYGKGCGQYHVKFDDGGVAVVTALGIVLPLTGEYHGAGIAPDHYVPAMFEGMPSLDMLTEAMPIYNARSAGVYALKQRLYLLGFLKDAPDRVWDDATLAALNAFQRSAGLPVLTYCDAATITALNGEILARVRKDGNTTDVQLEYALGLIN